MVYYRNGQTTTFCPVIPLGNFIQNCSVHVSLFVLLFCSHYPIRPQPYPVIYVVANPARGLLDRKISEEHLIYKAPTRAKNTKTKTKQKRQNEMGKSNLTNDLMEQCSIFANEKSIRVQNQFCSDIIHDPIVKTCTRSASSPLSAKR